MDIARILCALRHCDGYEATLKKIQDLEEKFMDKEISHEKIVYRSLEESLRAMKQRSEDISGKFKHRVKMIVIGDVFGNLTEYERVLDGITIKIIEVNRDEKKRSMISHSYFPTVLESLVLALADRHLKFGGK